MKYSYSRLLMGMLMVVVLILTSCKDELNQSPMDAPSNTNFFSNKKELLSAINGAYTGLWWGNPPVPMAIDDATDEGFIRSGYIDGYLHSVGDGSATSETDIFQSTWDHMYTGISKCNNLLENMTRAKGAVTEDFYTEIQAQARFLRGFYYFWLVQLYGDVPLITQVPTLNNAERARTSKDSVVAQIFKDLDFSAQNLPGSWPSSDKGRATKGAALTLKGRVALLNGKYNIAVEATKKVMNMDEYSLYPNYKQLFQYEGIRNEGVILDEPFKKGVQTTNYPLTQGTRNVSAYSQLVPSQFMIDMYEATDGKPIDESSIYDPAHPFENRDPRLDASIIRPGSIFAGYTFYTNPDSTMTTYVENGEKRRVANQDVTNAYASFIGYCWRKYTDPQDFPENIDTSELNFIYLRYAEVLLTYAEAKIEMNDIDQSVLNAINKVRARAYGVEFAQVSRYPAISTMEQNILRKKVRYERTVEFANEGLRLFDIRRWKIAPEVMDGSLIGRPKKGFETIPHAPEINEHGHPIYGEMKDLYRNVEPRSFDAKRDYLWAIPQSEIYVNDQIKQNPGY